MKIRAKKYYLCILKQQSKLVKLLMIGGKAAAIRICSSVDLSLSFLQGFPKRPHPFLKKNKILLDLLSDNKAGKCVAVSD